MRWIWLVLLCACGDNVAPRLVPVTYEVGDVTYTRGGQFHDTQRGEDCEPWGWADGATYCTPAHSDPVYTDAACTDPIAGIRDSYIATYFTIAGMTSLRRLRPTTPSTRNPAQYWVQNMGGCNGPYPAPPGAQWREIGDELDETAFVRLLRSAPEGDGRLQTIAWHTSDGLYQPMGFHDRDLGVDCTVTTEFGRDRDHVVCAPPADIIEYYADAACTQPVVGAPDGPPPKVVQLGCEAFAGIGSERTGDVYQVFGGAGCMPSSLAPEWRQYEVGAPVDVPVLSRVRAGSGRIQSITLVAGDVHVPDRYLHDTMIDADCEPVASDDMTRCLPTWQNIDTYYRDDQCMQTVGIVSENVGSCAAPVQYGRDPDGFHEVGAIVTSPLYVPSTGDICMEQPPSGEPHEVGPAVPVDTFVPAL